MIKDFKPRLYQETILATCNEKNTLVVIPTGMGKTPIALMLAVQRLNNFPQSKVVFLAPTRPLVEQHLNYFKRHLKADESEFVMFTGLVKPETRASEWKKARFIFSTPQGLENDVISGRIPMEDASLLVFDESHRAVGDYAYVFLAKQYQKTAKYPRILALTASPGSDLEKIREVCANLMIEDVEVRTESDPDMAPYIQDVGLEWVKLELPKEFMEVKGYLDRCLKGKLEKLKEWGTIRNMQYVNRKDLIGLQRELQARVSSGEKEPTLWSSLSVLAEIMKLHHAYELLESQGISALHRYMDRLNTESFSTKVKAVKNLARDVDFRSALVKTATLYEKGFEHPKLEKLKQIIKEAGNVKTIVFNQYRDSAEKIVGELEGAGISARLFVGQAKKGDTGLSQKKQIEMLDEFRKGAFNVLVSTAVGEEGLDIPQVDLVIFYEPIPSAIRHIQRRGRTGRLEKGSVKVLIAKNTRDEAYIWSAVRKEKNMKKTLMQLKEKLALTFMEARQPKLTSFIGEKYRVFADNREKGSGVIRELIDLGAEISLQMLPIADYIMSSRVAVEYKTVHDFVDSIVDGRLLQQVRAMKDSYERPLIIVEGVEDIYSIRRVHANAIQGVMITIAVNYGVAIIRTKNHKESASFLYNIARREQDEAGRDFTPHGRKPLTLREQQEYIVSALPGIGGTLAKPLLRAFGSVKKILNAKEDKLRKVDLIGEKKAKKIREVMDARYEF
ncbi:MAG: DEAD/DEAH box helicase [archaeon]